MSPEYQNGTDGSLQWFSFDGANFTLMPDPTDPTEIDFDKACSVAGFDRASKIFPSEFSEVTFSLTYCSKSPKILVCVGNGDYGLGQVVCTDFPAWLKFMKEYVHPICQIIQVNRADQMMDQIESTVFDPEIGIGCAIREAERSARWRRKDNS